MNIFVLGLFLLMTLVSLVCANSVPMPIEEKSIKSFREVINEKCHLSFVDTLFKELRPLEECSDWDKLNSIDELTRHNEKDVLCLLIYDSFVSFCGDIEKLHLSDAMLELQLKHNYTLEQVCNNLLPANKHVEHDLSKIITPEKCKKLCSDYDMKEPIVECSMAFYFTHFNMSSLVPSPITPSSSNTSDSVQHSNPEATVQGQQADTPVNKSNIVNSVANKATYVSEEEHHDSGKTNSISPGKVITVVPKKTNESVIVGQQPNPNNQETSDKTSQSEVTKPVDKQSEKIPSQQNDKPPISNETLALTQNTIGANQDNSKQDIGNRTLTVAQSTIDAKQVIENKTLAVPQNTIEETHQVAGALPNKVQGELATNKDNAEKGEGLSLNPEMEDDEFGEQDDEDLGAETGQEQQEPPEEAKVPQAAPVSAVNQRPKETENTNTLESAANEESMEDLDGGSYFFSYFMVMCVFFVLGYVGYHNRIKVMALVLEGKRNKRQYRGRRPNSANYHKLDSNLEEAISSTCTKNANNVIY